MATKNKRINLPPGKRMFKGPWGHMVYLEAIEIWLRGMSESDLLRNTPAIMLVPVGKNNKMYPDFSFDIHAEELEDVIQTLYVMQEEVQSANKIQDT